MNRLYTHQLIYIVVFGTLICMTSSCRKNLSANFIDGDKISDATASANRPNSLQRVRSLLVDKNASEETAALFDNLKISSKTSTLFGHQDDTKTGYGWGNVYNSQDTAAPYIVDSDVKKVAGTFPAVFGWDFMNIVNFYTGPAVGWEERITRTLAIKAYNSGGINTFSWHYHNPVSKEGIWWNQSPVEAVKHILPGGSHHNVFKLSLQKLGTFAKSLIGADGRLVPVIFRPFHEMNGDWFWWGKTHCTTQEYKSLYQFTVKYLRDSVKVSNFLYAWSPDRAFDTETKYLEYYPGDAYVDVVGMDNYYDLSPGQDPNIAASKLKIVSNYAVKKNKVAAFTETGLDKIPQADWFTKMLIPAIRNQQAEIGYVMLWSNTTPMYWTPYIGHPAQNDFISFRNNNTIKFLDRTPPMYVLNP